MAFEEIKQEKDFKGILKIKVKDLKNLLDDLPDDADIEFFESVYDSSLGLGTVKLNGNVVEIYFI